MSQTCSVSRSCRAGAKQLTAPSTGWHCASCQTSVVDFSRLSDAEVVAFLQRHPSSSGRFAEDQLDRRAPMSMAATNCTCRPT